MFRIIKKPIFGMGLSLLLASTWGCKGSNGGSSSNLDFTSGGLFQFEGSNQSQLTLRSSPLTSLSLTNGRSSLSSVTDYFFRLKFYKVTYAALQTKVNGSLEGDVNGIVDTGREMVISRDNILGGSVTITPVFDNGQFLTDGYYAIVMCRNLTSCTPPDATTLTTYKNAFLSDKCGNAKNGINKECYNLLFQDTNTTYMGIVYPITVQSKKFTQGDYDLAYNAGNTTGLGLASNNIQAEYVFESVGGGYEPVLQTNGSGQNMYDSLATSATTSSGVDSATNSPAGSTTTQNGSQSASPNSNQTFWDGVGKALVWIGNNQSSTPDNTAANNAASASRVASANAASAAAGAAAAGARSHDCFVAGSRIAVVVFAADGTVSQIGEKAIETITAGDYVYNPLLRTATKVKTVFKQGNTDAIYTLTITSTSPQVNQELTVTAAHPVITKVGLKPVALLTASDKVMMINKVPVTSQMDYSWFSVQKLLRTSTPDSIQVYNLKIDDTVTPIKIGADPSQPWWYYALSTDAASCPNDGDGCSKYFVSANQLVTGDLTRQQETEKLLQQAFVKLNNAN